VQAILLMLAAMFCTSAMNVVLRMMAGGLHSTQIVVLRHICSIFIILLWSAWLKRGVPSFFSARLSGHFWRATFGICAMEMWFYSVTVMPLNIVTALSFTTPIFSTIFAIMFLGERAGIRRWCAIAMGFVGMLIILRPDVSGVSNAGWIVIASSVLMAGSGTMVKSLTKSESPEIIAFYMAVFMLLWSIPFAIPYWQNFTIADLGMVFVVALFATVAHLFLARAFIRTEMVVLMPFDFSRLIFTAILAYIFFGETIDTHTILGTLVITASTIYIAHREAKMNAQVKKIISPEQ
jgi:drug/metabolite transporter (DMT)-like permease